LHSYLYLNKDFKNPNFTSADENHIYVHQNGVNYQTSESYEFRLKDVLNIL